MTRWTPFDAGTTAQIRSFAAKAFVREIGSARLTDVLVTFYAREFAFFSAVVACQVIINVDVLWVILRKCQRSREVIK